MRNLNKMMATMSVLLVGLAAQAQTARIQGVVNGQQKPVEAASVGLLRAKDSGLVKLAVTDKTGQFELEKLAAGKYLLSVQSVGYARYYGPVFDLANGQQLTLAALQLENAASELQGVVVSSKKPFFEQKIDKMVVNVDASPTNAGATAMEVLEKSPGVSVDKDGNISLKGKQGVIVMIDGKPTYLGAQDLANFLSNMPSANLDQIEIMSNPPAKFDAAGNSGVINIRTKKSRVMGYNGSITSSYGQGVFAKANNSVNFNYRHNKVNLFMNASQNYARQFGNISILRNFRDQQTGDLLSTFEQLSNNEREQNSVNYKVGLDYLMTAKTTVGFVVNGFNFWQQENTRNTGLILDGNGSIDTRTTALNQLRPKFGNVGVNLNLRHVFDSTGRDLSVDVDYLRYDQNNTQLLGTSFFDPMGTPKSPDEILRGILPANISIYSAKTDYSHPLKGGAKFEAGLKTSFVKTDNDAQYANWNGTQFVEDLVRSNHFLYEENINAAYVNLSKQFSKKWGGQLGLRLENTIMKGNQLTTGEKFRRDYTQLFPTVYVSYTLNDQNLFSINYGRRIDLPNYQNLNPFQYFLDKYTYEEGNPYLRPQFSHNIELTHSFKGMLTTSLNYSNTTDIIQDVLQQIDSTNSSYMTKQNIASRKVLGVSINLGLPVTKWWRSNVFLNGFRNDFSGIINGAGISFAANSYMVNVSNIFNFPKGWGGELSGFYRSRAVEGVLVTEPMGAMNLGISKQVMKNKGTVRLVVRDLLYTQIFRGSSRYQNVDVSIRNERDTRVFNLSFTYRFSKGKNVVQRKRGGANEEQGRVGMGSGK